MQLVAYPAGLCFLALALAGTVQAADVHQAIDLGGATSSPAQTHVRDPFAPDPSLTQRQRTEKLRELEVSGARPDARLPGVMARLFGRWPRRPAPRLRHLVRFGAPKCFAKGCYLDATYGRGVLPGDVDRWVVGQPEFTAWPGPKFRTGPIALERGATRITWILYTGTE